MPKGIDHLHNSQPFKVEISGGQQVFQWLNTQRTIHDGLPPINLPFQNDGDSVLPLGSLSLRDDVLQGMISAVKFSPEHHIFELTTLLETNGGVILKMLLVKQSARRFNVAISI